MDRTQSLIIENQIYEKPSIGCSTSLAVVKQQCPGPNTRSISLVSLTRTPPFVLKISVSLVKDVPSAVEARSLIVTDFGVGSYISAIIFD
jgi:hypothetical protein